MRLSWCCLPPIAGALVAVLSACQTDGLTSLSARDDSVPLIAKVAPAGPAKGLVADAANPAEGLLAQRHTFGTLASPALDAYAAGVLARLQRAWPDAPKPAHVFITPDPSFSAYSTADGAIFVTSGMIRSMESEDELAALLGHEYSHVLLGHHQTSALSDLSKSIYGAASLYLSLRGGQNQALLNEAVLEATQSGIMPALTRQQEAEADRLGTDLMVRAGYNAKGMVDFLERLADWENRDAAAAQRREERFSQLVETRTESNTAGSAQMHISLAPLANGIKSAASDIYSGLKRNHDDAGQRNQEIRDYIRAAHADAPRPDLLNAPWQALLAGKETKTMLDGIDSLRKVQDALERKATADASRLVEAALAGPAGKVAFVRASAVQVRMAVGKNREAVALLRDDFQRPDSLFSQSLLYIDSLGASSPKAALEAAETTRKTFNDPQELLPKRISLNQRLGNGNTAALLLAECVTKGNRALTEQCQAAKKGQ